MPGSIHDSLEPTMGPPVPGAFVVMQIYRKTCLGISAPASSVRASKACLESARYEGCSLDGNFERHGACRNWFNGTQFCGWENHIENPGQLPYYQYRV